ncbi:hypothetical protein LTR37_017529 [Vermiconidia calcicola]|uniref:Uncharacterized protein n=1 Tax=Vermiconidia calcicola TaxID=1690605 RepID=A0ACC3MMG4_9PEZI|nr:hypothetical protein LTR37_017529 [Vermiconidia calcicola]
MGDLNNTAEAAPTPIPASTPVPVEASSMEMSPPTNTTPSKMSQKRKAPTKTAADASDSEEDATPRKKAKGTPARQRKANKTPNKALPMANSYALSADHDKMLIDKRNAGASWEEIRKEWAKMTGEQTAHSTLPNRYSRLQSNFVIIKEEDNPTLMQCKRDIEAQFDRERWQLVSKAMEDKGTESYKPDALKRQYQKLLLLGDELIKDDSSAKKPRGKKGGKGVEDDMDEEE